MPETQSSAAVPESRASVRTGLEMADVFAQLRAAAQR